MSASKKTENGSKKKNPVKPAPPATPQKALTSNVEKVALETSGYDLIYRPDEKIPSIIVDNFPNLGRLTAVRFLEWVLQNPDGVISLPTGKTPEYFIKYVQHYLTNWNKKAIRAELESLGLPTEKKPVLSDLRFVQIDEFYPIDTRQHNSFYYYIHKYYTKGFGIDPTKALLIDPTKIGLPKGITLQDVFPDMSVDLTLRTRKAKNFLEKSQQQVINEVDQFCTEYERKIRSMGGICFFLGGIGPDGHIGFNIKGSDHYSTTRMIDANYETKAAAASDLGGIEVARDKRLITVGLQTITFNPNATAIIIAAGEAKAKIVARTMQSERSNEYPGSILQDLPNARFFLTKGASQFLTRRRVADLQKMEKTTDEIENRIVMNLAMNNEIELKNLTQNNFQENPLGAQLLKKTSKKVDELKKQAEQHLLDSLNRGMQPIENKTFLHTAPHHDDIILGYLPHISNASLSSTTQHNFAYMTSGFNAVTNDYMHNAIMDLVNCLDRGDFSKLLNTGYFEPKNATARRLDTSFYLEGAARHHQDKQIQAISRRFLRNMIEVYEEDNIDNIRQRCAELLNYFATQYPGKKDMAIVQQLKGRVREWESDLKWAWFGFTGEKVRHLRLGFYKGDIFTETPRVDRDVPPIYELLHEVNPDIVTVAYDPESSGPDTHYKVLQAIAEALKQYEKDTGRHDVRILGYRNVWFVFHMAESNIIVPCTLTHLHTLEDCFETCFNTQKTASFPSYKFDGTFSRLARKIQVKQFETQVKTCLGEDFFVNNEDHTLRACRGSVYLKDMSLEEFYQSAEELKHLAEAI